MNIYQLCIDEFVLDLLDFWVCECPTHYPLQRPDCILEVGGLLSFSRLSNGSLFWTKCD